MAVVKPECGKCAQNQAAFEAAALRLWEARIEIANLQDKMAELLEHDHDNG